MFAGIIHFLDYLLEKENYLAGHPLFIFLPSLLREGPWYSSDTQWGTHRTMPHPLTLLARKKKFGAGMKKSDENVPIIPPSLGYSGWRVLEQGMLLLGRVLVFEKDQPEWEPGKGPPKLTAKAVLILLLMKGDDGSWFSSRLSTVSPTFFLNHVGKQKDSRPKSPQGKQKEFAFSWNCLQDPVGSCGQLD